MSTTTTRKTASPATPPSPADASAAALTEALSTLRTREVALTEAQEHAEALRERLDQGDDTVTSEALRTADAEVERARLLTDAAVKGEARARRALVNTETTLAEAVAAAVAEAVGVPAVVTTVKPSEAPADLPALFIVQSKPSTRETIDGYISGAVDVLFYRAALHRAADADRIETVAGRAGVRLAAHDGGSRETAGVHVDTVRLDVRIAHEPVPVIRPEMRQERWPVTRFSQALGGEIADQFFLASARPVGVRLSADGVGGGNASAPERVVRGGAGVVREVSDTVGADGVRRRVVEVAALVAATSTRCPWSVDSLRDGLAEVLRAQEGQCYSALGRVESVTVGGMLPLRSEMGRQCSALFTFISRAPSA